MYYNQRSRILCVEDNRDTCDLLAETLPHFDFAFAHNLADGLTLARFGQFDLFLLDNWLPDGSGIDLCREIRERDAGTPIVFLSAAAYQHDHDQAMAAGASAYLDKPFDFFQLESILTELLRQAKSRSLV
jgi:DNA-binding response OmpR family regulator